MSQPKATTALFTCEGCGRCLPRGCDVGCDGDFLEDCCPGCYADILASEGLTPNESEARRMHECLAAIMRYEAEMKAAPFEREGGDNAELD
jgi:hypothetical protein